MKLLSKISIASAVFLLIFSTASVLGSGEVEFDFKTIDSVSGQALIGDIDNDGRNDIIAHCNRDDFDNHLAWYHYPDMTKYTIEHGDFIGYRFAVGDMDGDGDLDIVSGKNIGSGEETRELIYWYENPLPEGNPRWEAHWRERYVGESGVKDIFVADINRDGKADIISRSSTHTMIFFPRARGWLRIRIEHPDNEGLALGDLDADGDIDLVLNGYWLETPGNAELGKYELHEIDKKWYTQKTGEWRDNNCYVRVADINQDGILDVVLSHSEKVGWPISWYSIDDVSKAKTGPWKENIIEKKFDWCQTLDVGDVDGDGTIDVIAAKFDREFGGGLATWNNKPPYPVVVYYNINGDGSTWKGQVLSEDGIYAGVLGDLGSDGDLDIVGPRSYWCGPIKLWENKTSKKLPLDKWTYIPVDDNRTRWPGKKSGGGGWFGLAMGDVTGDGFKDIVSGNWFYRNPGGDMTGNWDRIAFGDSYDAIAIINADDDNLGDVFAVKCKKQYWLEAKDEKGSAWKAKRIGKLPVCDHGRNVQGYTQAQIIPGGKPEIIINGDGLYYITIPDKPKRGLWPSVTVAESGSNGEGVAAADLDGDGDIDICGGSPVNPQDKKDKRHNVLWYENPGDGSGNWQKHIIGMTVFNADRMVAYDLNGDDRVDIAVTEERSPGKEPDSSLYWFEQPENPKNPKWKRHHIITQYTMNNLDAADMDGDGDIDLVTGEHRGPNKKVQVWENSGKVSFKLHLIDQGKENHLGTLLADMDNDGDMDMLGIAWDDFQYLHLWRNDAISKAAESAQPKPDGYYIPVKVEAVGSEYVDKPVETDINFGELIKKPFDENSIKVAEVDSGGSIIDGSVTFQFDKAENYDAGTNAKGTLIFVMKGRTPAGSTRNYRVYFTDGGFKLIKPSDMIASQVSVIDDVIDAEENCFKIITQNAIYYFDERGSGFTSILDMSRKDWIGYKRGGRSAGEFRGIPNLRGADFHPGRGEGKLESKIISSGPLKVKILSETEDRKWGSIWEIYPYYAKMTLFKKGDDPYYFLYEGTPGGKLDMDTDFWVKSDGMKGPASQSWDGDLIGPEWVYFVDGKSKRALYLVNHTDDTLDDTYRPMKGNMTVFGFGRSVNVKGRSIGVIDDAPRSFTIGFSENSDFEKAKTIITSAYTEPVVSVGSPKRIK